jgi:uncharacterized protein YjiS (DUF1127 family)
MTLFTQSSTPYALGVFDPPGHARRLRVWLDVPATVLLWRERRRTRQHLGHLDDRALADVGLTQAQQRSECAKSFWQP